MNAKTTSQGNVGADMARTQAFRVLGLRGRARACFMRTLFWARSIVLLAFAACCGLMPRGVADDRQSARPEEQLGRNSNYDYDIPEPGSYALPVIKQAPSGSVLVEDGTASTLQELMNGHVTVLSFIYTRCRDPKACPTATGALHTLHQISKKDSEVAAELKLISMSFDPAHDTPGVMSSYGDPLRADSEGAPWHFVTAPTRRELNPILKQYGQQVDLKKDTTDPLGPFYHQLRVYLIDSKGMIRNIYSFGLLDLRLVMTDIRTLIAEEEGMASVAASR